MNRREHVLTCLGEEGNEVGQRVAKGLRFGMSEVQPGQPLNNAERIAEELRDLWSVATIYEVDYGLPRWWPTQQEVAAKRAKIERFMAISREQGALVDDDEPSTPRSGGMERHGGDLGDGGEPPPVQKVVTTSQDVGARTPPLSSGTPTVQSTEGLIEQARHIASATRDCTVCDGCGVIESCERDPRPCGRCRSTGTVHIYDDHVRAVAAAYLALSASSVQSTEGLRSASPAEPVSSTEAHAAACSVDASQARQC